MALITAMGAEFWFNTNYNVSIGQTPFQTLYGKEAPILPNYIEGSSSIDVLDRELNDREWALSIVKSNLIKAQNRMKLNADKHRQEIQFNIDDWVLVKLQPYRQYSVAVRLHNKLSTKYFGPYKIKGKISKVAYQLSLPIGSRIHDTFHISKMKKFVGTPPAEKDIVPIIVVRNELVLFPLAMIDYRVIYRMGSRIPQALILWSGAPVEDTSWEDIDTINKLFPSANLEGKVVLQEGYHVT